MDSKELRIGNLINDNSLYTQVISDHLINDEYYDGLKGCLPIPLTEEWLIKFGFEESEVFVKVFLLNQIPIGYGYAYRKGWQIMPEGIEIKHVHQLQNLYFALTGEELTIKDNE